MEELTQRKQSIRGFNFETCNLGSQGFNRLLIQLFGFSGHGKSSFINTCKYVLDGREFRNVAKAGRSAGGRTTKRSTYPLTQTITLVDNRGCGKMDAFEKGEIFAQLANLLPLDREVEWNQGLGLIDRVYSPDYTINMADFIFPVFVFSVKNSIAPDEQEELRELLLTARDLTGIFPVVVLTHKHDPVTSKVQDIFRNMGAEQIFAVENYTEEDHIKAIGRDEEVLRFLSGVIRDVEFRMTQWQNPERDARNRMHFLTKYVSQRELRIQEQENEDKLFKEREDVALALQKVQGAYGMRREQDQTRHRSEMEKQRETMEREREKERKLLELEMDKLLEEIHKLELLKKKKKSKKHRKEPCAIQ